MRITVYIALFAWPAVSLALFSLMRPRRAAIASVILGWLFLPVANYRFPGIIDYTKTVATSLCPLLGVLVFDLRKLLQFRPNWKDIPMAVFCLCPFASSLTNDLGVSDGMSTVFYKTMSWGVPYLLGRLYCSDLLGMFELAVGIFLGGLLYVPLCLFEIRMSPTLHLWLYGFHQHSFFQTFRFGGWRPTVFMFHGLMVGMWMAMASLVGIWLWMSRSVRTLWRIPMPWLVGALLVTTVMCKSLGSLALLAIGLAAMLIMRTEWGRASVLLLLVIPPLYYAFRIPKVWSGEGLTDVSGMISEERQGSLQFRLENEDILVEKATRKPLFGWGTWGRARPLSTQTITDGLWIIELGDEGYVGLCSMAAVYAASLIGLIMAVPPGSWKHPAAAPAVALCVVGLLFQIDCLFNYMAQPAFMIGVGGLASLRIGIIKNRAKAAARVEGMACAPRS